MTESNAPNIVRVNNEQSAPIIHPLATTSLATAKQHEFNVSGRGVRSQSNTQRSSKSSRPVFRGTPTTITQGNGNFFITEVPPTNQQDKSLPTQVLQFHPSPVARTVTEQHEQQTSLPLSGATLSLDGKRERIQITNPKMLHDPNHRLTSSGYTLASSKLPSIQHLTVKHSQTTVLPFNEQLSQLVQSQSQISQHLQGIVSQNGSAQPFKHAVHSNKDLLPAPIAHRKKQLVNIPLRGESSSHRYNTKNMQETLAAQLKNGNFEQPFNKFLFAKKNTAKTCVPPHSRGDGIIVTPSGMTHVSSNTPLPTTILLPEQGNNVAPVTSLHTLHANPDDILNMISKAGNSNSQTSTHRSIPTVEPSTTQQQRSASAQLHVTQQQSSVAKLTIPEQNQQAKEPITQTGNSLEPNTYETPITTPPQQSLLKFQQQPLLSEQQRQTFPVEQQSLHETRVKSMIRGSQGSIKNTARSNVSLRSNNDVSLKAGQTPKDGLPKLQDNESVWSGSDRSSLYSSLSSIMTGSTCYSSSALSSVGQSSMISSRKSSYHGIRQEALGADAEQDRIHQIEETIHEEKRVRRKVRKALKSILAKQEKLLQFLQPEERNRLTQMGKEMQHKDETPTRQESEPETGEMKHILKDMYSQLQSLSSTTQDVRVKLLLNKLESKHPDLNKLLQRATM